jgi:pimeloyl-ACP methyl ester carboxylesterase
MEIKIQDVNINYIQYGKGKDILLLHGWGQNIEMMKPLGDAFANRFRITILDLPGFGESEEPKEELSIYDYADILKEMLDEIGVKKPVIIGHSFGGRIGIIYASKYDVKKLILMGAPCVRSETKESFKVRTLKALKKVPGLSKFENFAKNHIGSTDYKNASPVMKKILVNTVNEDLSDCARKIEVPTLLIWGENDVDAPLEDAKKLEALLKDGGLVTYEGGTHYTYLEFLNPVCNVIRTFI